MDGLMDKIFSEYGLVVVMLIVAIGAVWLAWQKALEKIYEVINLYHEDSKMSTVALNALTDWIKDRQK